jgi:hypothetical protein
MSEPPWTWSPSSISANNGILRIAGDSTGKYILGGGYDDIDATGRVYISTDSGSTWSGAIDLREPGDDGTVSGVACSSNGGIMYAVTTRANGRLYRSTNYGTLWTVINTSGTSDTEFRSVCCDALGKKVLIASNKSVGGESLGQIWFCADPMSSPTWTAVGPADENWNSLAVNSTGTLFFALAGDNNGQDPGNPGLYRSTNGTIWTKVSFPVGIDDSQTWTYVAFSRDDSTAIICSSGIGTNVGFGSVYINKTPGNDNSWTKVPSENGAYVNVALNTDGNKVYACNIQNGLYYGTSTSLIDDSNTKSFGTAFCVYINPISGNPRVLGLAPGQSSALYIAQSTPPPPPICFKEGSKILCFIDGVEQYIPIETMRPGTLVKTALDGYKPVAVIGFSKVYNPGNGTKSVHHLVKCTPAKYPELTEDLVLTGAHSILVSDITDKQRADLTELGGRIFITDDKYRLMACVDDRSEPYEAEGLFTIWHFALEHTQYTWNYGVYANGLLVETTSLRMIKEFSGMTLLT